MDEVKQALAVCPQSIARALMQLPDAQIAKLEEIRLRNGSSPSYLVNDREKTLCSNQMTSAVLQEVLDLAGNHSVYAVQDMLKSGYLTINGGHRIGICGRGVYKDGEFYTLRDISSVNIRIARQIKGAADDAIGFLWTHPRSTLIIGPPGRGKTTLLRDLIRQLSDRFLWRICVVDERMELGACVGGVAQFSLGGCTDILSGTKKAEAIEMLLRSMNPQWIALDEITAQQDIEAICRASYCGVRFLATAHTSSVKELHNRPLYRHLLEMKVFENVIVIDTLRKLHMEVLTND